MVDVSDESLVQNQVAMNGGFLIRSSENSEWNKKQYSKIKLCIDLICLPGASALVRLMLGFGFCILSFSIHVSSTSSCPLYVVSCTYFDMVYCFDHVLTCCIYAKQGAPRLQPSG